MRTSAADNSDVGMYGEYDKVQILGLNQPKQEIRIPDACSVLAYWAGNRRRQLGGPLRLRGLDPVPGVRDHMQLGVGRRSVRQ